MTPRRSSSDSIAAGPPAEGGQHDPSVDPDGTGATAAESEADSRPDVFVTDNAEAERQRRAGS